MVDIKIPIKKCRKKKIGGVKKTAEEMNDVYTAMMMSISVSFKPTLFTSPPKCSGVQEQAHRQPMYEVSACQEIDDGEHGSYPL